MIAGGNGVSRVRCFCRPAGTGGWMWRAFGASGSFFWALCWLMRLGGSLGAWRAGGLRCAGLRLRPGAFALGLPGRPPLRHLRQRLRRFLQIPSGLSTPRAPQAPAAPGSGGLIFTGAGAVGVLLVLATRGVVVEDLAGPAPGRPRGRPCGAYAVSGVGARLVLCGLGVDRTTHFPARGCGPPAALAS
ncbi:hypothetical protein D3C87_1424590 [compost metagenome]